MILSQTRVNELLQIFNNPRIIEPYNITYQKEDGTLLDKEVSDVEDKIKFELLKNYHAELRG